MLHFSDWKSMNLTLIFGQVLKVNSHRAFNFPQQLISFILPYSNRISPWLTEFGPLQWQAKQTVSALWAKFC